MMGLKKVLLFLITIALLCSIPEESFGKKRRGKRAQTRRKSAKKDAMYIKAPPIRYKRYRGRGKRGSWGRDNVEVSGILARRYRDTTSVLNPNVFEPRPKSILREDSVGFADGEQSIVEVSEEYKIDTTWVKLTEYYSLWDAYSLNPYRADISKFDDTLNVMLYDTSKSQTWSFPLKNSKLTSDFGRRGYRWHYGVDLDLETGDSVLSVWDGIVRLTNWDGGGYGNYVLVRHYNGLETLYGHLSDIRAQVGQIVQAGDLVGKGGSTGRSSGPHLHFEIRFQGVPMNPADIYDFSGGVLHSPHFVLSPERFQYLARATTKYGAIETGERDSGPLVRRTFYHKVRSGETLMKISIRYGVSVSTLMRLNGLKRASALKAGKRIRIR